MPWIVGKKHIDGSSSNSPKIQTPSISENRKFGISTIITKLALSQIVNNNKVCSFMQTYNLLIHACFLQLLINILPNV